MFKIIFLKHQRCTRRFIYLARKMLSELYYFELSTGLIANGSNRISIMNVTYTNKKRGPWATMLTLTNLLQLFCLLVYFFFLQVFELQDLSKK